MKRPLLLAFAFVLASAAPSTVASAGETSALSGNLSGNLSADPQLDRLKAAGHSMKFNYVPQGRKDRYGHAETIIKAPIETVRGIVLDYKHYQEFAPNKFKMARVVGKDKERGTTDLYIQVPILKGMATLWSKLRFDRPRVEGTSEIVEGKFLEGIVDNMNLVFTMRKIDDSTTLLSSDLLIVPKFPAPQAAIDEELRDAAMNAVDAVQSRSEHR